MTAKENETFALWGGEIWGKNREVIKREKLIQEWHDDKDNDGMIVTFTLENRGEKTVLTLVHENIPEKKYSSIKKGWKEYYLGPLQELVERSSTS